MASCCLCRCISLHHLLHAVISAAAVVIVIVIAIVKVKRRSQHMVSSAERKVRKDTCAVQKWPTRRGYIHS